MRKKILLSVSAIIVVVLTAFTSYWTFGSKTTTEDLMLSKNIEALTQAEEPYPEERSKCISEEGNWNMASVCQDSGIERISCSVSGEISAFGITLKGSYEKGESYNIPWARYTCTASSGNCCKKQGMYTGETKLA